ncbi:Phage integrase family protein (fragment) [Cupriavidus oxalaticus]|uniref:Phage integrase family protein n=1 Tax=Cupriavidus oxalaticus TaxID=96344 RepID=A0A375GPM7_9BURK
MKMLPANPQAHPTPPDFPDAASLAALRAWYEGVSARDAVVRYLGERKASGQSARGVLGHIRRLLAEFARRRQRQDLAALFAHGAAERVGRAKAIHQAVDLLRRLPPPEPQVSDDIGQWLPARAVGALRAHGIETLADLTVRIPRRRRWWTVVPGLGPASARRIEAFFAEHRQLTERARALIAVTDRGEIVPWEQLRLPHEVDGSSGAFRAPRQTCTLNADND